MHTPRPRRSAGVLRTIGLVGSAVALAGCGFGTVGILAGSGGGGGGGGGASNGRSVATSLQVPRAARSPAPILFVLTDPEGDAADLRIGYRQAPATEFRPITLAAGSAPLTGRASGSSVQRVDWDFATDLGGEGLHVDIDVQLVVENGISPPVLVGVTLGNDAPRVLGAAAAPSGQAEFTGETDVTVALADSSADPVRLRCEYNRDVANGFPDASWQLLRPAGIPAGEPTPEFALVDVATTPAGREVTFRWDTAFDLAGFDGSVRVRCSAADAYAVGAPAATPPFRVDNNAPPRIVFDDAAFALGPKQRGNVPVPFAVFDDESDPVRTVVQWRTAGQEFPPLPSSAAALLELLDDPARAAERRAKQIAVEAPPAFTGRVGPRTGLAANQLRLPELATAAAGALAGGLVGRTVEILRPSGAPQPVAWPAPPPLAGPVAAIAADGARTALVLDGGAGGWRLCEIDLASGAVVRQLTSGAGAPRALAVDPSGQRVFVGTGDAVSGFGVADGAPFGSLPVDFVDGPRALAALGRDAVLATGDDRLVRFDFAASAAATVLAGLGEPWGVVADPLAEGRVYVAERALDRIATIDLDDLQLRQVAATVAPDAVAALGATPFPSPRALALEDRGARLLVMTQHGALASLRALDLQSPLDRVPPDGVADPDVREISADLGEPDAAIATGPDRLRIVTLRVASALALAGGVAARATIAAPYSAADPVVTTTGDVPAAVVGATWRIRQPLAGASSPAGRASTFVWDTSAVPAPAAVQLRIVPCDADVGTAGVASAFRPLTSPFDALAQGTTIGAAPLLPRDVDGDGDLDLIQAETGALAWFPQTAPRRFSAATFPLAPQYDPRDLLAGDFDGDGDLDVAWSNSDHTSPTPVESLVFAFQTAPGVFGSLVAVATPDRLRGAVAADFDRDGDLDVAAVESGAGAVRWFVQGPAGVFTLAPTSVPLGGGPVGLAAGDLDGDGDLDLVVVDGGAAIATVVLQDAAGGFAPGGTIATSAVPVACAIADLDGDGDADVAIATADRRIDVARQTAPGVFAPVEPSAQGSAALVDLTAVDLDADGDVDLVAGTDAPTAALYYQTAPGVFTAVLPAAAPGPARAVRAADLDGDGRIDLVSSGGALAPRFQVSERSLVAAPDALATGQGPRALAAGDLDADGDLDLVTSDGGGGALSVFVQTAPGVFSAAAALPAGDTPAAVATADLDGDGDVDVVAANHVDGVLTLYFQAAPGVLVPSPVVLPTGALPATVVAVDLDGDGDVDLATGDTGSDTITLYFQTAPGAFAPAGSLAIAGLEVQTVVAADLDGDGDVDLATGDRWFAQTAPGLFAPAAASFGAVVVTAADDLDGDGDLDLVVAAGQSLRVQLQIAPGEFGAPGPPLPAASAGALTRSVATGDLDGDGGVDIVVADPISDTIEVCRQLAPGVFVRGIGAPPTGNEPVALTLGDFDGDGDLDVATANRDSNTLRLFFGGR